MADFFGFDLLLRTVQSSITNDAEVIVILVHWFLTKNSNFRAIGIGDDRTLTDQETGSELLPDGWNGSHEKYTIRYVSNKNLYILIGTSCENMFLINLLNVKTNKVSNIAVNPTEVVKAHQGTVRDMIPSASDLINRFQKELIDPVFTGNSKEGATQTEETKNDNKNSNDLRMPSRPQRNYPYPNPNFGDPLRDVGRGDLMPGGFGGGMLFDPTGPRRIGPGVPNSPGIRFDPFAPPGFRNNPDNDHFRPPRGNDWDDNMFM
ncbi:PSMF1 family protein [Megaselia abdita]